MVEHHDELKTTAAGRRLQWAALCTEVAELSLTDINGKPASEDRSRDVARARRAVETRISSWRPSLRPASERSIPPASRRTGGPRLCHRLRRRRRQAPGTRARGEAGGAGARAGVDPPLTEEEEARVEAALDQVREQFREKDWYLNPFPPPKRRAD